MPRSSAMMLAERIWIRVSRSLLPGANQMTLCTILTRRGSERRIWRVKRATYTRQAWREMVLRLYGLYGVSSLPLPSLTRRIMFTSSM